MDPETGEIDKIIVVPTSRYLGNEDGRGGFGALLYDQVMSQLESYNTDADHPILVVLHHDGDNYGGGTDSYYGSNFNSFVSWLQNNPTRFECTTIQDYLDRFPPATDDIIHVEPGSWAGADNGDPEFKKWLGSPQDLDSWTRVVGVENTVQFTEKAGVDPVAAAKARNWINMAQTSCYWYWDGTEVWDDNPDRAVNLACVEIADVMFEGTDIDPPTIFLPQREPYNPAARNSPCSRIPICCCGPTFLIFRVK